MSRSPDRTRNSTPVQTPSDQLPDLTGISYAEISRGTGISPSMLSRLFSDDPRQKRANPTLRTLKELKEYLEQKTGAEISYDTLIEALT